MMQRKEDVIISSIVSVLKEGPKSISDVSKCVKINWRTAENKLNMLKFLNLVYERDVKNTRTYYYKDENNFFNLPIDEKTEKKILATYNKIKKFCQEIYKKEPTKTQVYKIFWKLNLQPAGWYKYGPCAVKAYTGDETSNYSLPKNEIKKIKEITEEYCKLDNDELENKVYNDNKSYLYQAKKELSKSNGSKDEIYIILLDFLKYAPKETYDVVDDFIRATLLLGWDKTISFFEFLWDYIAKVNFKNTLNEYYKDSVEVYFNKKIEYAKKEIQTLIDNAVKSYTDSKHSQDKLYQRWVKKKK